MLIIGDEEMNPEDFLKNGKVHVWKPDFVVIKAKNTNPKAFANIVDKQETTVIIDETLYDKDNVIEIEKGWKLLTFDMVLPFELVGFMAAVAKVLADVKISILPVSAYSTDHILIKKENLSKTKEELQKLGCNVIEH